EGYRSVRGSPTLGGTDVAPVLVYAGDERGLVGSLAVEARAANSLFVIAACASFSLAALLIYLASLRRGERARGGRLGMGRRPKWTESSIAGRSPRRSTEVRRRPNRSERRGPGRALSIVKPRAGLLGGVLLSLAWIYRAAPGSAGTPPAEIVAVQ